MSRPPREWLSVAPPKATTYGSSVLWLSAVLIALVSNLDNLAVGLAFGMRGTPISATPNLVIAVLTMIGTAGAITSGHAISGLMSPGVASALGASIIIVIGVWTVLSSLDAVVRPASAGSRGRVFGSRPRVLTPHGEKRGVGFRAAIGLGAALALNNVGVGVGAGVAGISPVLTTLLAGAASLVCVGAGSRAGRTLGRLDPGGWSPLVSGLILLGIGTAMLTGAA